MVRYQLHRPKKMSGVHPMDIALGDDPVRPDSLPVSPGPDPTITDPHHPNILRHKIITSFADVIKLLSDIDTITDILISKYVFTVEDAKRVTTEKTEERKARELLHILDRKPDHGIIVFVRALEQYNHNVYQLIMAANVEPVTPPMSDTIREKETLYVYLEACVSQCLCADTYGHLDLAVVTKYIQQQCSASGLPHTVTDDVIVMILSDKFDITVSNPQFLGLPIYIKGVSWMPEIRDRMINRHTRLHSADYLHGNPLVKHHYENDISSEDDFSRPRTQSMDRCKSMAQLRSRALHKSRGGTRSKSSTRERIRNNSGDGKSIYKPGGYYLSPDGNKYQISVSPSGSKSYVSLYQSSEDDYPVSMNPSGSQSEEAINTSGDQFISAESDYDAFDSSSHGVKLHVVPPPPPPPLPPRMPQSKSDPIIALKSSIGHVNIPPGTGVAVLSDTIQYLAEQLHLMISPMKSHSEGAQIFLERLPILDRMRVVSQPVKDKTALYKAFYIHSYNLMVYLIEDCHADVNQMFIPNHRTERTTLLCQAASSNRIRVAELLIQHGADVNKANEEGSLNILDQLARSKSSLGNTKKPPVGSGKSSPQTAAKAFAVMDANLVGMTPVLHASCRGHYDMVSYLVKSGAQINKADQRQRTCLMVTTQYPELLKYLLSLGGEVDDQDCKGDTALHWAVQVETVKSVRFLLQNRVEVNIRNNAGDTALHIAIQKDMSSMVSLLLDHGEDMYVRNKQKEDALMLATLNKQSGIIKILLERHRRNVQKEAK